MKIDEVTEKKGRKSPKSSTKIVWAKVGKLKLFDFGITVCLLIDNFLFHKNTRVLGDYFGFF